MIFISHREYERDLAAALTELIISSLEIPDNKIRATSVAGYQLPFGKTIAEQLKADINESDAVFVLITPSSLQSNWVLFELGASWALGSMLIPILAPGLTEKDLPGPLAEYPIIKISATDAGSRMRDAIKQVSTNTGFREKTGGRAQQKLEIFLKEFRDWKGVVSLSIEQARAFQLCWLLVSVAFGSIEYPSAALAEIEILAAQLEVALPDSWRGELRIDDGGHALQDLIIRLAGQIRARRPKVLEYFQSAFNLLVSASNKNDPHLEGA